MAKSIRREDRRVPGRERLTLILTEEIYRQLREEYWKERDRLLRVRQQTTCLEDLGPLNLFPREL